MIKNIVDRGGALRPKNCFAGVANICCNYGAGDSASALLIMALTDRGPDSDSLLNAGIANVSTR
jgi:hypothetical protein